MRNSVPTTRLFLGGFLAFIALALVVERNWGIRFETNDDVAMMMMAHGFGIAGQSTPLLIFSNIWEGFAVQAIGWPLGVPGYGVYLLGWQVVAMAAVFAFSTELNGRPWLNLTALAALGLRAVFTPQFTVVAGFLALAAMLAVLVYRNAPRWPVLAAAVALALVSLLMRDHLFLFVAIVALPFVLRPTLMRDRRVWAAGVLLLGLALGAHWHQSHRLSGPEWAAHHAQNAPRAAFTDFQAAPRVAASPAALEAAGWSMNDLAMVENWWLVDGRMASPEAMRAALDVVGLPSLFGLDSGRLQDLQRQFTRFDMMGAILLVMAAGIWLRGTRLARLMAGVALLTGLALFLTASGRLGVSRIYYPPLTLLACAALAMLPRGRLPGFVVAVAVLGTAALTLAHHIPKARAMAAEEAVYRAALDQADPARVHVVWGDALPFEWLYRPLAASGDMPRLRLYGLGSTSFAPWAVAQFGGSAENVTAALRSPEGLSLITSRAGIPRLVTYCAERLGGTLKVEELSQTPRFILGVFRCGAPEAAG